MIITKKTTDIISCKQDLQDLYNIYLTNVIIVATISEIETINTDTKIVVDYSYISDANNTDNPYLNDEECITNLGMSVSKYGNYWIFLTGESCVKEGNHRYVSLKYCVDNDLVSKEQRFLGIKFEYSEAQYLPVLCLTSNYNTKVESKFTTFNDVVKWVSHFLNIPISIRGDIYRWNKTHSDDRLDTSLLCNNYKCLKGAVEHYKNTGEFILDNAELEERFNK